MPSRQQRFRNRFPDPVSKRTVPLSDPSVSKERQRKAQPPREPRKRQASRELNKREASKEQTKKQAPREPRKKHDKPADASSASQPERRRRPARENEVRIHRFRDAKYFAYLVRAKLKEHDVVIVSAIGDEGQKKLSTVNLLATKDAGFCLAIKTECRVMERGN